MGEEGAKWENRKRRRFMEKKQILSRQVTFFTVIANDGRVHVQGVLTLQVLLGHEVTDKLEIALKGDRGIFLFLEQKGYNSGTTYLMIAIHYSLKKRLSL